MTSQLMTSMETSVGTDVGHKCTPLGIRWGRHSMQDETVECNLATLSLTESSPVKLLACVHSFHAVCLEKLERYYHVISVRLI